MHDRNQKRKRDTNEKDRKREWGGRDSQAMGKQLWKWKKYVFAMRDKELWEEQSQRKGTAK